MFGSSSPVNKDYTINMVFSLFNLRLGLMSNYKLAALHLKWSEQSMQQTSMEKQK